MKRIALVILWLILFLNIVVCKTDDIVFKSENEILKETMIMKDCKYYGNCN
jgi:hypothetical protein